MRNPILQDSIVSLTADSPKAKMQLHSIKQAFLSRPYSIASANAALTEARDIKDHSLQVQIAAVDAELAKTKYATNLQAIVEATRFINVKEEAQSMIDGGLSEGQIKSVLISGKLHSTWGFDPIGKALTEAAKGEALSEGVKVPGIKQPIILSDGGLHMLGQLTFRIDENNKLVSAMPTQKLKQLSAIVAKADYNAGQLQLENVKLMDGGIVLETDGGEEFVDFDLMLESVSPSLAADVATICENADNIFFADDVYCVESNGVTYFAGVLHEQYIGGVCSATNGAVWGKTCNSMSEACSIASRGKSSVTSILLAATANVRVHTAPVVESAAPKIQVNITEEAARRTKLELEDRMKTVNERLAGDPYNRGLLAIKVAIDEEYTRLSK